MAEDRTGYPLRMPTPDYEWFAREAAERGISMNALLCEVLGGYKSVVVETRKTDPNFGKGNTK